MNRNQIADIRARRVRALLEARAHANAAKAVMALADAKRSEAEQLSGLLRDAHRQLAFPFAR
jgi:hypothetical protein